MSKNTTFRFLLQFFTPERLEDFSLKIWLEFSAFPHTSFLSPAPRPTSRWIFNSAEKKEFNSHLLPSFSAKTSVLFKFKSLDDGDDNLCQKTDFRPPSAAVDLRAMENRWTADTESHFSPESAFRLSLFCVFYLRRDDASLWVNVYIFHACMVDVWIMARKQQKLSRRFIIQLPTSSIFRLPLWYFGSLSMESWKEFRITNKVSSRCGLFFRSPGRCSVEWRIFDRVQLPRCR